jgi:uncharacterized UBP type Zn finger protein
MSNDAVINPHSLYELFLKLTNNKIGMQQEDSQEGFTYFIEAIDKNAKFPLGKLFSYRSNAKITCMTCNSTIRTKDSNYFFKIH